MDGRKEGRREDGVEGGWGMEGGGDDTRYVLSRLGRLSKDKEAIGARQKTKLRAEAPHKGGTPSPALPGRLPPQHHICMGTEGERPFNRDTLFLALYMGGNIFYASSNFSLD